MLTYSQLSKSQKLYIDTLVAKFPKFADNPVIDRKELESTYWELNKDRTAGGAKVGYPNWLTASNKIARGQYQLPVAGSEDFVATPAAVAPKAPKVKATKPAKAKAPAKAKVKAPVAEISEDEVEVSDAKLAKIIESSDTYDFDDDLSDIVSDFRSDAYTE